MTNVFQRRAAPIVALAVGGIVAVGALLSSAAVAPTQPVSLVAAVATASPIEINLQPGQALLVKCPANVTQNGPLTARKIVCPPGATASPSASPSDSPTASPTASPTPSPASSPTPSPTASPTPSPTPTVAPTPTATPTAPPSSTPPQTASGPITVTRDGQVVENVVIDSNPGKPMDFAHQRVTPNTAIYVKNFRNVTIRNVTVRGYYFGIQAVDTTGLTLLNVKISDTDYCGVCVFGGSNGQITAPSISNIGALRQNVATDAQANNAYGIAFMSSEAKHGINGSGMSPTDWVVNGGSVDNSPLWMCVNSHESIRVTIQNMALSRCPRGVFFSGQISSAKVLNNRITQAVVAPGGINDKSAITYGGWTNGTIDGNQVSSTYSTKLNNIGGQFGQGPNVGVVVGANPTIP